jgi:hypothetical protein
MPPRAPPPPEYGRTWIPYKVIMFIHHYGQFTALKTQKFFKYLQHNMQETDIQILYGYFNRNYNQNVIMTLFF